MRPSWRGVSEAVDGPLRGLTMPAAMPQDNRPPIPREELQQLVAGALRRSLTYLDKPGALASAEALLRDLNGQGFSLPRRRLPADEEPLPLLAAAQTEGRTVREKCVRTGRFGVR